MAIFSALSDFVVLVNVLNANRGPEIANKNNR